ncbi:NADPH-dependent FMN reductase [Methylobacterium nodulans]|uniref:NADPH-dependent FMN reductase n=1 Tax=Methylobacterium nodulans (strain LMG 21967 / CNCM I-2342 / ORS 2060) TaxID=460265 RepID=B8IBE5_METNO|nr:NAD(P)H-dependent oxidoreductase [Methylobacterium nodulans]ACL57360.1 NADPH-dependent FMN reductase [Methylobacterium nodulans ORS 2060]
MSLKLHVIIGSTRPGRIGPSIARWFDGYARRHGAFEPVVVDLAEFDLPLFNEPKHPRAQQYEHEHTRRWSHSVAAADAYAFVTPEYNYGTSPALLNALDYLVVEWGYKPAGVVSYGGVSGGLRGAQHLKQTLATLKMVTPPEGVGIPNVGGHLKDGAFVSNELIDLSAKTMLDELSRWAAALKPMRAA